MGPKTVPKNPPKIIDLALRAVRGHAGANRRPPGAARDLPEASREPKMDPSKPQMSPKMGENLPWEVRNSL